MQEVNNVSKLGKIQEILENSISESDIIKKVRKVDNETLLVDCNFAKAVTLKLEGNKLYVNGDKYTKIRVANLINKLIEENK